MVMLDGNGDFVARDGGSGDSDATTNGRLQVNGLTAGSYQFRIEGDDVGPSDSWSLSMEECVASGAGSSSDGLSWYFWPLVASNVLLFAALISIVIWWLTGGRCTDTDTMNKAVVVPQQSRSNSFSVSSPWPSWKTEDKRVVQQQNERKRLEREAEAFAPKM